MWTGRSYDRPGYSRSCSRNVEWLLLAVLRQLIQELETSAGHCALVSLSLKYRLWAEQLKPRILANSIVRAAGFKILHMYGGSRAEVRPNVPVRVRTFRREERTYPKTPPGRRQWRALLNVRKCSCTVHATYDKAVPITTGLCNFKLNKQGKNSFFSSNIIVTIYYSGRSITRYMQEFFFSPTLPNQHWGRPSPLLSCLLDMSHSEKLNTHLSLNPKLKNRRKTLRH
jgi:hypothetical protein